MPSIDQNIRWQFEVDEFSIKENLKSVDQNSNYEFSQKNIKDEQPKSEELIKGEDNLNVVNDNI